VKTERKVVYCLLATACKYLSVTQKPKHIQTNKRRK